MAKSKHRREVVGVMGGGRVNDETMHLAEEMGRRIAEMGYVLLTGGRPAGVMEAASRGAHQAGGLVVGVLPGANPDEASPYVHLALATALSDGRNLINVLSSDVVVACPGGAGTLSEVALAIKNQRPLVLLRYDPGPIAAAAEISGRVVRANSPAQAADQIKKFLTQKTL